MNIAERFGSSETESWVAAALDTGINLFDTAENYQWGEAEKLLGDTFSNLHRARSSFCLCTKAFFGSSRTTLPTEQGLTRKHLVDACHGSLRRLRFDYIDIFLCHNFDPHVEIGEIVWTMHTLTVQGKILHWGTSKWPTSAISAAIAFAKENRLIGPVVEQSEYNVLARSRVEGELADLVDIMGLGIMAFSPLKEGILAGRYDLGIPPDSRLRKLNIFSFDDHPKKKDLQAWEVVAERFSTMARDLGLSSSQLAIGWCLKNRYISTVILGASSLDQLLESSKAIEIIARITPDIWVEIVDLFESNSPLKQTFSPLE